MELKMRISRAISTSQSLGIFDISDESKVRIIVQEAGPSNTLIVRGRLKEQPNFIELYTIIGSANQVINVFTYEEIQIECTVCEPTVAQIKVYAASFSEAGGSAIDSIDVPSGDSIKDFNSLSLTSDDGSIAISGDNSTKTIDFTANGLNDLKDVSQIYNFHVYENNSLIYADASPGVRDTSSLLRDGWYFRNTAAGQKINWYFFDGRIQGTVTLGNFSAYAVMTFDVTTAYPILAVYTFPTGSGDVIPGFAHSKVVYSNPLTPAAVAGVKYLVYFGDEPAAHPELPRIRLTYSTISSAGSQNPSEIVFTSSFGSDSSEPVNQVQFLVESMGVWSPLTKQEMQLRIRTVPLNAFSKIDSIYLPSYVDDVEEYSSLGTFPLVGESSKIYVALDTNRIYRWSGSLYIEISQALVTSVNGDVGDVLIPIDEKVNKIGDVMSGTLSVSVSALGTSNLGWQGVTSQSADFSQSSEYTLDGVSIQISDPGVSTSATTINPNYVTVSDNDILAGTVQSIVMESGQISLELNNGIATIPITPTLPQHVTTKKYVDDQDALKEDVANKSIDGTLASNSDTLYPSQKAVKTYADSLNIGVQSNLDASTYYHELHVNFDYLGAVSDGSPYKPFKTIQTAVNAAQLTSGANTAILIHLKKDTVVTENVVVSNAPSNLYIAAAIQNNTDSSPIKITGSLTISGTSTTRVRVKDLQFAPTSGYALIVNDSNGRHMFQNCQFSNGAIPALAGTGVNLTSTYKNFIEFIDCTIEGVLNIAGSPNPGTTVSLYRCRLGYANVIVNSSNVAVGMYDTYGLYSLNHTAGALAIFGLWGMASAFNSTANMSATNFISISNASLQKYDLSFVPLNKTGTCFYQLVNVLRGETADVLTGTRTVFGPTATDAGYKMGVSGNWSPSVSSVAPALDQLVLRVKNSETSSGNTTAILNDTKEPTGFINRTDSNVSFVNGTRIFTIAPTSTSFSFYIKGTKFTKTTAQNLTIPNLPGNHYIYFNTSGVLESTQVFSSEIIEIYAFISIIYWNTDTNTHTYFAEERHGITMDGATHSYLHTTFGSRYLSGLALQDFTIGNGSLDSHAQFSTDEGSIRDEDILLTSPVQSEIPILFRQGQLWRKKAADAFPLIYNDGIYYSGLRIPFNEYVAGSWQLTAIDSNKFVLVHFFATNDKETPIVGIQGIAQYNDIPAARNAASTEITSLSGLPFAEFVAIGSVVFQTNSYTNTPDARVRNINGANYVDFRGTQLYTPAGEATEHSLLSGLGDDDHIQYHTDSRADARYYTKSEIDNSVVYKNGTTPFAANQSMGGFKLTNLADPVALTDAVNLQTLNSSLGSSNDLLEKSFPVYDEETIAIPITDFNFANSTARSFNALVSVRIQASSNLSETFQIRGIQKDSDWYISISSEGDYSKVIFSIDSSGQMYYVSGTYAGFIDGVIKFRAITTSV